MANSTTNLDLIATAQSGKEITANGFFDAASNAVLYGRRQSTCGGLVWGYFGGSLLINGSATTIANGTLTLGPSVTTYVEASATTGAVTQNLAGFTPGRLPLYVIVTNATAVTSYNDVRSSFAGCGLASVVITGDLLMDNPTAACKIVELTGTPSAGFNVTIPSRPWEYTLNNMTGQAATVKTGAGSTVVVAAGKVAKVYASSSGVVLMSVSP